MIMNREEIEARYEEFWEIYETSFPANERRTREDQLEVMMGPYYCMDVIEEDGKILAFIGYWQLPGCSFVEHLATTPACRGKGYGKDLVLNCIHSQSAPIFLEIEPITEADPMTARRAGFYQRLGFHCNHFPYQQMPLKPGDEPCDLWVMSYGKEISEKDFEPYKKEIYNLVYKVNL